MIEWWELVIDYENGEEARVKDDDTKVYFLRKCPIITSLINIRNIWWVECAKNEGLIHMEVKILGRLMYRMGSQKEVRLVFWKVNLRLVLIWRVLPKARVWSKNLYLVYLGGGLESRIERTGQGRQGKRKSQFKVILRLSLWARGTQFCQSSWEGHRMLPRNVYLKDKRQGH